MLMAAKLIGAAIASVSLGGAAVGAGVIFNALISGVARNPSIRAQLFTLAILAFSMTEAIGLFALALSFMILFAF
jgi:F-type H+-transporting ATPase subunit c